MENQTEKEEEKEKKEKEEKEKSELPDLKISFYSPPPEGKSVGSLISLSEARSISSKLEEEKQRREEELKLKEDPLLRAIFFPDQIKEEQERKPEPVSSQEILV
jgi:hypothetical protein